MSFLTLFLSTALAAGEPTLTVGQPARLFSLPAINEDAAMEAVQKPQVSLTDFTGVRPAHPAKAVVLYFFDRQNGGDQLIALNHVQRRYGGKGVQVVAISVDKGDVGEMSTWLQDLKLGYPVVRDNHGVVSKRYGADKLPLAVVIDGDGYLFAMGRPETDLETELSAEVAALTK